MASFTDAITQFNPYVSQLPVDAMVKVGMQKQAQYEQGVQKIQSEIDKVAGLDIAKDIHKNYLQSKLNELGGKLNTVAAGDFSNFQLVNSVSGMTKQVVQDKIVQNAIASTAKLRKEQARGETLKKQGKSSINREFDFANSVNNWLNDNDLTTSFNGEFKEHIDVNKKVLGVIEKLHGNAQIKDFPYVMNPDGSINYQQYAITMQRQGIKALDEGTIKTAVNAVLDSNDYDELASQGRYNYRGYDVTDLQEAATRSYKITKEDYTNKLNELKRQLLTTNDLSQQLEINNSIKYYTSLVGDGKSPGILDENYQNTLKSIESNPDEARSSLYTRNWLDQIANGFSWREVTDEVLANPGRADFWNLKNYEAAAAKEANENYWKSKNYEIAKGNLAVAMAKEKREAEKDKRDAAAAAGDIPYFIGSGDETTDKLTALENYTNYIGGLTTQNSEILNDLATQASNPNVKVQPKDILLNIEKYKNGKYTPTSNTEKAMFDKYIQNSNTIKTQETLYRQKEDAAYRKLTGGATEAEAMANALKGKKNLRVPLPTGGFTEFSPKEVLDYLTKESIYTPPYSAKGYYKIDDAKLTDREKLLKRALAKRYTSSTDEVSVNPATDAYLAEINKISPNFKKLKGQVTDMVANDLSGITGNFKTEQAAVVFKDSNEKNRFIGSLTNIAGANLNIKVAGEDYTPKEIIEAMQHSKSDDIEIQTVRSGNKYFIQVLDKATQKVKKMPVDEQFVATNPSLGTKYLNQGLDLSQTFLRNGQSTNIYKDWDHAYYHNGLFGRIGVDGKKTVTLPVVADLQNSNGDILVTFKMKTKDGKFVKLPYPNAIDYSTFETEYLPGLTNDKVLKLFKTQYPNIEQIIAQ